MSDQFVAEIRIFAGNFAPFGWATCDGQIMPISQNTALFSLLGTTYGGDGKTNFALPNLDGSAPLHQGSGPGLTQRFLGESGGEQTVTLISSEMPAHTHTVQCVPTSTNPTASPANASWGAVQRGFGSAYATSAANTDVSMSSLAVTVTGGSQPHNNMPPYLALTFIIALQGIFPSRA